VAVQGRGQRQRGFVVARRRIGGAGDKGDGQRRR